MFANLISPLPPVVVTLKYPSPFPDTIAYDTVPDTPESSSVQVTVIIAAPPTVASSWTSAAYEDAVHDCKGKH